MNDQTAPTIIEATPVDDSHVPAPAPDLLEVGPTLSPQQESLNQLLANGNYRVKEERSLIHSRTVEPAHPSPGVPATSQSSAVTFAPPSAVAPLGQRLRNGKIARLPKLERDMVNKLLQNHIPYSKIVWALEDRGVWVTERNISNWRTRGGYKEWCAEQENQVRLAQIQDHLTDYLRKNDAEQIPEVGLQFAATQMSSALMHPETAQLLRTDPDKYAKIVNTLEKISGRIHEFQKDRYETHRRAKIRDTLPNLREKERKSVEALRALMSAEVPAPGPRDEHIPHRNDLSPRETLPHPKPDLTYTEMLELLKERAPTVAAILDPGLKREPASASPAGSSTPVQGGSSVPQGTSSSHSE